uniref:YabP/YqfC family sporulation protein n=1 Tax=Roseburia inulinivorans TaxID=360807 RepID=UPI004038E4E0
MSKNSKKPIHEKMISQLELPKDLMLGAAIVTITGRKEVLVENYKGIIELEESLVNLQTNHCRRLLYRAHL